MRVRLQEGWNHPGNNQPAGVPSFFCTHKTGFEAGSHEIPLTAGPAFETCVLLSGGLAERLASPSASDETDSECGHAERGKDPGGRS